MRVWEHFLKFWCRKAARRFGEKHIMKSKCSKTGVWEHFLKFWCRKIAGSCGEKHVFKSKCTKHLLGGALFEILMSKNCTQLWRKAYFQVHMYKNTSWVEHFLKFWCRKIARGCGEKHIMKSKCAKHVSSGQFFEVLMSKNCTRLWREAHLEVKMYKTRQRTGFRSFDVQKLHAVVARSTLAQFDSKGCKTFVPQNTCVLAHSFKFRCPTISQVDQDARLWCFCFKIFFVVALFLLVDTTHVCSVRYNQQQKMLFGVTVILMSHNRFSVDVWTKLLCLFWPPVLTFHWVSFVSCLTVSACAE